MKLRFLAMAALGWLLLVNTPAWAGGEFPGEQFPGEDDYHEYPEYDEKSDDKERDKPPVARDKPPVMGKDPVEYPYPTDNLSLPELDYSAQLFNHPDSQLARTGAPDYGLRLNGYFLEDVATKYTFDFEYPGAELTPTRTGNEYSITGQIFGGSSTEYEPDYLDMSNGDPSTALWNLSWTMFDLGQEGCPYLLCLSGGSGTLSSDLGDFDLTGLANEAGIEFAFIDGFRGFEGITGWGWMNWENIETGRRGKGDFMFMQGAPTEVPLPPALLLFGTSLAGLWLRKRQLAS